MTATVVAIASARLIAATRFNFRQQHAFLLNKAALLSLLMMAGAVAAVVQT